jgi:signal transduction histidine kinase
MRWRIRSQLLVPVLILLPGVVGICIWTAVSSANRAQQQIETRLRNVAEFLSKEINYKLSGDILRQMKPLSGADYLVLPQGGGEPLSTLGVTVEPPPGPVYDDWQQLQLGQPLVVGGQTYFCSGLRLSGKNAGDILYILYPEASWRDALWEALTPILVLGSSMGLAAVGLAVGLGRHLSRRIQDLERRTRLIAAGDFSPMPLPGRDDEIRDLARSVNEMAQQLAKFQETVQRTERLRLLGQVSGGLAHQLRNGMTGVRLAVQLYVKESAGQTDTAALAVALRQLTLLETHLKRFLELGRTGLQQRERCSLTALVGEAVDLLRPQCAHAGIEFQWQRPVGDFPLFGDAGQLGQMLVNVLGNAIEAAGPCGNVAVQLRQAEKYTLEVSDSGAGPSKEVAGRLFEPFVTGKPEGVGLGLAVARQAAEAHGGTITWSREADRTVFRIELPLPGSEE